MSQRKHYSSQEKVKILREHFEQNLSVPEICEKYRIHPNQFYRWKKIFFEKAAEVFSAKPRSNAEHKKIEHLQNRLNDRNDVIAELLEENLKLKKAHGES
jgi:transposase-like protein